MNNYQPQTSNDILNYLCRFINNKPISFSKIAKDLKLNMHDLEENIQQMMHMHPEWYTVHKRTFSGNMLMLNAPMLKEIHKFLVFGGYANEAVVATAPVKENKAEEKQPAARNTVIIRPRLDFNHS